MSERDNRRRALGRLFSARSAAMKEALDSVAKVLDHPVSVLIEGEPGTGKNALAEAIHTCGNRAARPFVRIDCATLPADLFESELFGYEKGTFTGADARKSGKLETAQRGTVYLDEVASLSSPLQAKLLRVLQDRVFTRLGGSVPISIDVRVISSSNRPLRRLLDEGELRPDLYYRLNVFTVTIPPLRQRRADIAPLAERFLMEASRALGKQMEGFEEEAMALMTTHGWPGNVRELKNVVERAAILESGRRVSPASLPLERFAAAGDFAGAAAEDLWTLEELESRYIREVLRKTGANYSKAAAALGINRKTLLEKRRKYGLE